MRWNVMMVVAKLEEGMEERVVVFKFMESQDLKIVTIGDKFEMKRSWNNPTTHPTVVASLPRLKTLLMGHDETGGPVQDEVGLEDDDRGGEFRADTELGDDEEGVGDARPVKRKRPNKKYSADVFDISMIRARCPAPNPIVR
jgi:hypothetical protein